MSADSQWAVQQAIVAKLKGAAALTAIVGQRIYDDVPQGTAYPYIVVDDMTSVPFDTQGGVGAQVGVNIYCWSQYRGRKEVRQMMDAIYAALNRQALTISGHAHIDTLFMTSSTFRQGDGRTYSGMTSFRVTTEPTS